MLRYVEMQDTPTIVADDEEAVEHPESDRWNREEVHGRNRFPVIPQKGEPALGWLRISRRSLHPAGDRSLGKIKTEHEKFTVYPRRSPGRIFNNHPEDQIPNLLRRLRSPNLCPDSGDQPPVQAETDPVPPDNGFGCDNDQGFFPS